MTINNTLLHCVIMYVAYFVILLCLMPGNFIHQKEIARTQSVNQRGENFFFLSGNLGQRLEIFCVICNITILKTKQMHKYCIICTSVIMGFRLVFCHYVISGYF